MSTSLTRAQLKALSHRFRAELARAFALDVKLSTAQESTAHLFMYKDWNTALACAQDSSHEEPIPRSAPHQQLALLISLRDSVSLGDWLNDQFTGYTLIDKCQLELANSLYQEGKTLAELVHTLSSFEPEVIGILHSRKRSGLLNFNGAIEYLTRRYFSTSYAEVGTDT